MNSTQHGPVRTRPPAAKTRCSRHYTRSSSAPRNTAGHEDGSCGGVDEDESDDDDDQHEECG